MLEQKYDVIIIELDSDPEYALELVESIGANGVATVMVYSENTDPELLMRCMRAGAREFLTLPFDARGDGGGSGAGRGAAAAGADREEGGRESCWRSWAPRAAPERPCWPAILP